MPTVTLSDGLELCYETWGDPEAPPVLLLHGLTGDHRMFAGQFEALAQDYFVVAPDMRGHGRTAAPPDLESYTMKRFALDVHELLDHLSAPIAAVCGCSFGGMVALQFATTWPARVACLVLTDTSPAYDRPEYAEPFRAREAGMRANEETAQRKGTAALGKELAATLSDPFLADGIHARYLALSADGFLGSSKARRERPDVTALLRERLTMPVLLCMGEDDAVSSALEVMSRELPGARVVTFAEAGHGLPVVRPVEFTDTLLRFLDDVEAGEPVGGRERVS